MYKNTQKILCLMLVIVLSLMIFTGCGSSKKEVSKPDKAGEGPKKLSIITVPAGAQFPDGVSITKSEFYDLIKQKTGYDLDWSLFKTSGTIDEQLNLLVASGNAPDLIQTNGGATVVSLAKSGALTPLDDALNKNGANIKKDIPQNVLQLGQVDGKQYSIARYTGGASIGSMAIRKDWLDELGLKSPKTLDEYYEVLKKFKDNKKGVIPLIVDGSLYRFTMIMGSFGIYNYGSSSFSCEDGKIVYPLLTDKGKEFIKTMNKWYKEGLIDSEFLVDKEVMQKMIGGKGAMMMWNAVEMTRQMKAFTDKNPNGKLEYIEPPVGKNGEQGYMSQPITSMSWIVPKSSSKKVNDAIEFLDLCQNQEIKDIINFGIEGKHYTKDNGQIKALPAYSGVVYKGYYSRVILDKSFDNAWVKLENGESYVNFAEKYKKTNDILYLPMDMPNYIKQSTQLNTTVTNEVLKMIVDGYDDAKFNSLKDIFNKQGGDVVTKELQTWYDSYKKK